MSSVKIFQTDDGSIYTVTEIILYYTRSCFYDEELLIKETSTTTQLDGAEGNHTELVCEFIYNHNVNDPKNFELRHECDDIEFDSDYYRTVKYGCCGAETYFELYNYKNPTPLLKYNSHLLKITGSNDNKTYFFGYLPVNRPNKKDLILGTLYFASDEETINEITFKAKNREIYKNILPWTPRMNFSPKKYDIV